MKKYSDQEYFEMKRNDLAHAEAFIKKINDNKDPLIHYKKAGRLWILST